MAQHIANPEERLTYYRKAADEAQRNAQRATDPDVRSAYYAIMRTWVYLAEELEREMSLADHEPRPGDGFVRPRANGASHKSH